MMEQTGAKCGGPGALIVFAILALFIARTVAETGQKDSGGGGGGDRGAAPDSTQGPPDAAAGAGGCEKAQGDETALCGPSGLQVFMHGKSGALRIYRTSKEGNKTGEITIVFVSATEFNVANNETQPTRALDFSKAAFQVGAIQTDTSVPNSEATADCIPITVTPAAITLSPKSVGIQVCAIKTGGTVTQGDETTAVTTGQLKFSLTFVNWVFSELNKGHHVDVVINLKIPPGQTIAPAGGGGTGPAKFDLGGTAFAVMSRKYSVDGKKSFVTMPDGYPKYEQRGANNVITLRLMSQPDDYHTYTFEYDPVIEPGPFEFDGADRTVRRMSPASVVCVAGVAFALVEMMLIVETAAVVMTET